MIRLILKYLPSVIIPTIVTIIITIIFGNNFKPEHFGQYSLFLTSVTIINYFLYSFMSSSMLRFYNSYSLKNNIPVLLGSYIIVAVLITFTLIIVGTPLFGILAIYFAGSLLSVFLVSLYVNYYRAAEKVVIFNLIKCSIPIINLMAVTYFIFNQELNTYTAILSFYGPFLMVSISITLILILKKHLSFKYDKTITLKALSYGYPIAISSILGILLSSADRYMIKIFVDSTAVGYYSFAYRIAELSMINMTLIVILALYPRLIKMYEEEKYKMVNQTLNKYINLHFIILIPVVFIIFLNIEKALYIFFPLYTDSALIVKYVAFGTFFYSLSYYTNKSYELSKNTKTMLLLLLISTIVNLLLNALLIPYYNTMGAVLSTIISYFLYVLLSIYFSNSNIKIKISVEKVVYFILLNVITTVIVTRLIIFDFNLEIVNLIINIIGYVIIYALLLFISLYSKLVKI